MSDKGKRPFIINKFGTLTKDKSGNFVISGFEFEGDHDGNLVNAAVDAIVKDLIESLGIQRGV